MSFNQTNFYEKLEQLGQNPNPETFFFEFLELIDTSKATINALKKGENPVANSGLAGMARKSSIYFEQIKKQRSLAEFYPILDDIKANPAIKKQKIRIILLTDFEQALAYDTKLDQAIEIERFDELNSDFTFFLPLVGVEKSQTYTEHPADVRASEKMGRLFDQIRKHNDFGSNKDDIHALNLFLTRLLFCFFADDTGIFDKDIFVKTLEQFTQLDGSDTDEFFNNLFAVLNLAEDDKERKDYPSYFEKFPYVNGGVFKDMYAIPQFTGRARRILLECARLNWSEINPDIFGSMFQAVIDPEQRSQLGQHYTSVSNIMKVIDPLFLEPLKLELKKLVELSDANKGHNNKLERLQQFLGRLRAIKVFDPACGSGNFLITAYKQIRLLEIETLQAIQAVMRGNAENELAFGFGFDSEIPLSNFYGIDYDDFPVQIAYLSLYLAEHQMNAIFRQAFGHSRDILPLQQGGNIVQGNSLRMDWQKVCPNSGTDEIYVVSNPPFNGKAKRTESQTADLEFVWKGFKGIKNLDFVTSWFWLGANYIKGTQAKMAMVATNSVSQGEQVSLLFKPILNLGLEIQFAYPTFVWKNNAKDNATVHVVIIGLADKNNSNNGQKAIYHYNSIKDTSLKSEVKSINPYLVEGNDTVAEKRSTPITYQPEMVFGSMPNDGGFLLLTPEEKEFLIYKEPKSEKWIKKLLGAEEFLNGKERYCLWLIGISEKELNELSLVKQRVRNVRQVREHSSRKETKSLADTPHLFGEIRQPTSGKYILVPSASSERRQYVPIDFLSFEVISTNRNLLIPNATIFDFGILNSKIHNDWMRLVTGRLKSDYNYSITVVYNTFPFPKVNEDQNNQIENLAKDILRTRHRHQGMTLAELYNPETMPADLKQAHQTLDDAVDKLYREQGFKDTAERLEFLLKRYEQLIAEEKAKAKKSTTKTKTTKAKKG